MVPVLPKKKMVTTRSSQKLSSIPESNIPEQSSATALKLESDHVRARSKSPSKPRSNQSSPLRRPSHISEHPTALSGIDETSKPPPSPLERLNVVADDSSDLYGPPSTIVQFSPINKEEKIIVPESIPPPDQQPSTKPASTSAPEPELETEPEHQHEREHESQPPHEPDADARTDLEVEESLGLENAEFSNSPMQRRPSESLRSLIAWSRNSLAVDEDRLVQMLEPESEDVMRAHRTMDGLHGQYEQARREYECRRLQHREYVNQQIEIRIRRREVDQAERELEELCHLP